MASDKVEVYCEYCKETHTPLRLTYEKNIARNEQYVCEKYGGHIAGSKPKKKKENPHAADGKKKCTGPCGLVMEFEFFSPDKSRSDGLSSRCKACRAAYYKEKYGKSK